MVVEHEAPLSGGREGGECGTHAVKLAQPVRRLALSGAGPRRLSSHGRPAAGSGRAPRRVTNGALSCGWKQARSWRARQRADHAIDDTCRSADRAHGRGAVGVRAPGPDRWESPPRRRVGQPVGPARVDCGGRSARATSPPLARRAAATGHHPGAARRERGDVPASSTRRWQLRHRGGTWTAGFRETVYLARDQQLLVVGGGGTACRCRRLAPDRGGDRFTRT